MRYAFALPVLGLLLIASCGGSSIQIRNSSDRIIGNIDMQGEKSATMINTHGDVRGRVRGNVVRDDAGKNLGSIEEKDGTILILDPKGNPMGTLGDGTDCYGKGQEKLGSVSGEVDVFVAAGACLVFFLQ